jgi:hypothetical protein
VFSHSTPRLRASLRANPEQGPRCGVRVEGLWGTPPSKPLRFKCVVLRAACGGRSADPTGGKPRLSCALFILATTDVIYPSTSLPSASLSLSKRATARASNGSGSLAPFVFGPLLQTKKPCLRFGKQGSEICFRSITCLPPPVGSRSLRAGARRPWTGEGQTPNRNSTDHDVSPSGLTSSAESRLICSYRFSSNAHLLSFPSVRGN